MQTLHEAVLASLTPRPHGLPSAGAARRASTRVGPHRSPPTSPALRRTRAVRNAPVPGTPRPTALPKQPIRGEAAARLVAEHISLSRETVEVMLG